MKTWTLLKNYNVSNSKCHTHTHPHTHTLSDMQSLHTLLLLLLHFIHSLTHICFFLLFLFLCSFSLSSLICLMGGKGFFSYLGFVLTINRRVIHRGDLLSILTHKLQNPWSHVTWTKTFSNSSTENFYAFDLYNMLWVYTSLWDITPMAKETSLVKLNINTIQHLCAWRTIMIADKSSWGSKYLYYTNFLKAVMSVQCLTQFHF